MQNVQSSSATMPSVLKAAIDTSDTLRDWLLNEAYTRWWAQGADPINGGFHERLRLDGIGLDEASFRSMPDYPGGTSRQRHLRTLLRQAMEDEGFTVYAEEWWHFDYKDWREYPIANIPFEEIPGAESRR